MVYAYIGSPVYFYAYQSNQTPLFDPDDGRKRFLRHGTVHDQPHRRLL